MNNEIKAILQLFKAARLESGFNFSRNAERINTCLGLGATWNSVFCILVRDIFVLG